MSHPHAHLKRAQAAGVVPKPVQGDVSNSFPTSTGFVGTTFGENTVNGVAVAPAQQPRFAEHHHLGYPMPSVNGMNRGPADHAFTPNQAHSRSPWMAEPKHNHMLMQQGTDAVGQLNHVDLPPIDANKPQTTGADSNNNNKRPVAPQGPNANGNNNHGSHSGEIDWSTMLQPGAQEGYMNTGYAPTTMAPVSDAMRAQMDNERKYYPAASSGQHQENGGLNGLYLASTGMSGDGTSAFPPRLKV